MDVLSRMSAGLRDKTWGLRTMCGFVGRVEIGRRAMRDAVRGTVYGKARKAAGRAAAKSAAMASAALWRTAGVIKV